MNDIFYGVGLLIVLLNISSLLRYRKIFEINDWLFKYKKVIGKSPNRTDFRCENDVKLLLSWSYTVLFTVIWMFFGLLSSNWYIFLLLFISNVIFNSVTNFFQRFKNARLFVKFVKSLILTGSIAFLVINHFHLKIDIHQYIKVLILNH